MKLSQRVKVGALIYSIFLFGFIFAQRGKEESQQQNKKEGRDIALSNRSQLQSSIHKDSTLVAQSGQGKRLFHTFLGLEEQDISDLQEDEALNRKLRTMVSLEEFRELLIVIPPEFCSDYQVFFEDLWKFYPIENNEEKFISLLNLALEIEGQAFAGSELIEGMFFMLGKNLGNADYPEFYSILREREVSAQTMREFAYGFESVRIKHNEKQRARDFEFLDRLFEQSDDRFAPFGRAYSRLLVNFTDANLALDELIQRFADRPETQESAFDGFIHSRISPEQIGLLVNSMNWDNPTAEMNFLSNLAATTAATTDFTSEYAFGIITSFARVEDQLRIARIYGRSLGLRMGDDFPSTIPVDIDPAVKEEALAGYRERHLFQGRPK